MSWLGSSSTQHVHQRRNQMSDWKVRPRSEVEELVTTFVVENKMSAYYGKDTEGVFVVKFMVEEEPDE